MADMPRTAVSRRRQVIDSIWGILHETLWIAVVSLLAFGMAVIAVAVYR